MHKTSGLTKLDKKSSYTTIRHLACPQLTRNQNNIVNNINIFTIGQLATFYVSLPPRPLRHAYKDASTKTLNMSAGIIIRHGSPASMDRQLGGYNVVGILLAERGRELYKWKMRRKLVVWRTEFHFYQVTGDGWGGVFLHKYFFPGLSMQLW